MKANDMDTEPSAGLPAAVRQHLTRYKAPPGLERRIRHMVGQDARAPAWAQRLRSSWTRWTPVAGAFAGGVLATVLAVTLQARLGGVDDERTEQEVVAGHVRSMMANHLTDVASTDQHTVKPWFAGKLDYAPPVVDLAAQGFPLAGGRLDYVHDRPVAALVYRRHGHTINVFVLPATGAGTMRPPGLSQHGYQVADWQRAGMRFWAVSDVTREEMASFSQAMQAALR